MMNFNRTNSLYKKEYSYEAFVTVEVNYYNFLMFMGVKIVSKLTLTDK